MLLAETHAGNANVVAEHLLSFGANLFVMVIQNRAAVFSAKQLVRVRAPVLRNTDTADHEQRNIIFGQVWLPAVQFLQRAAGRIMAAGVSKFANDGCSSKIFTPIWGRDQLA